MVKQFDFDNLIVLAHLGLWEHVEFYGAERYGNLIMSYKEIGDYLQFTYHISPTNLYPAISVLLDLETYNDRTTKGR